MKKVQSKTGDNKNHLKHISTEYRQIFRGPLPPPDILIKYEQACPGAADRIISMAENQARHRQGLEAKVVNSNVQNEKLGMWLAFILTVVIMLAGVYLLMNNKQVIGYIAFFGPVLFQAGNYIYNKNQEKKHIKIEQKDREELKNKN